MQKRPARTKGLKIGFNHESRYQFNQEIRFSTLHILWTIGPTFVFIRTIFLITGVLFFYFLPFLWWCLFFIVSPHHFNHLLPFSLSLALCLFFFFFGHFLSLSLSLAHFFLSFFLKIFIWEFSNLNSDFFFSNIYTNTLFQKLDWTRPSDHWPVTVPIRSFSMKNVRTGIRSVKLVVRSENPINRTVLFEPSDSILFIFSIVVIPRR